MTTLTTLASFTGGLDGGDPGYGSLITDANGDLFGTTLAGGSTGDGTVFELVNTGSGYTLQTLASLTYGTTGSAIFAGLTMDAQGDLFGVAQQGGTAGDGTVFELVNTGLGYSLQTLMSFSGSNGFYPTGALVTDANGDLFGTTQAGGANNQGTVFELVKGASGYTFQTVVDFNFTDGSAPAGPLIADSHGDLFGTTLQGGTGGSGTVFELVNTGSGYNLVTLADFNGSTGPSPNGSSLYAGLTMDAHGDLFGTTYGGGGGNYGTVFELVNTGSGYAYQTLATLDNASTGAFAIAGLTLDAHGDLYGAAMTGGPGGFGTVFELVNSGSSYSLKVLYAFSGADGGFPEGTPLLDANGDLIGTTAGGGTNGSGTVFELAGVAPTSPPISTPTDDDTGEQAALGLTVNGGSTAPIGAAGAAHVAFTVAGMDSEDTGVVVFTDQANHAVMVQVSAGQTSYVADLSSLTDGAISASLQVAADPDGASFTPVAGNGVTLDTTAPAAPTGLADAAISNGYVNQAYHTAGQVLTGFAEAGAVVTVYDNNVKLGTTTADASTGAWSFGFGALADGAQSLTATATDASGNTGAPSAALTFIVETVAPAVSNVTDAGRGLSTVSGTSEAGSTVTLYDNGQKVGVDKAGPDGTWSVTLKLNGGQAHAFTETAVDLAGDTAASAGTAYWANPANRSFAGGPDQDVFVGTKGDSFTTGSGPDHFVFNAGFGSETVAGFRSGADQISFDHTLFANASAVLAHAHSSGANTVITDGQGDQLLLQGVLPSQLHASDFHVF